MSINPPNFTLSIIIPCYNEINTINQLKQHDDTIRTIPYDSSSGMNYALYDHLINTTLDLSYTAEYYYTPDYRNGELFRYIRSCTESTGSASTQPPNITTINII